MRYFFLFSLLASFVCAGCDAKPTQVKTCDLQYVVSQKSLIDSDLQAISVAKEQMSHGDMNGQAVDGNIEMLRARNVYQTITPCSYEQAQSVLPELKDFFDQFPYQV